MSNLTEDEWWQVLHNNWLYILDVICGTIDTFSFTDHNGRRTNIDVYHQLLDAKKWNKPLPLLHFMSESCFGFPEKYPIFYENGMAMIEILLKNKGAVVPELEFIPEEGEEWKYQ